VRTTALFVALIVGVSTSAHAQTAEDGWAPPTDAPRPTSGTASFLSGRTLGTGEVLMAAALGWPGLWAHVELAPSSLVNVGVRGSVLYGSPVMGLVAGAGGELIVPVRVHLYGEGELDVALRITPQVAAGEGRLFGESASDIHAADLGISSRLDVGARLAWRATEQVTLFVGADVGAGVSWVDTERAHAIGVLTGTLGIEAMMSSDTMLFAEAVGGGGIADGGARAIAYYPQQEVFRLSLGLGYLL
jgi:hypothetical protein